MAWKKVEKIEVRAIGGRGSWDRVKMVEDLKGLEKGYYQMPIQEFLKEYYTGGELKKPVIRAVRVLKEVIEESEELRGKIEVYGSPSRGLIMLKVKK